MVALRGPLLTKQTWPLLSWILRLSNGIDFHQIFIELFDYEQLFKGMQ